MSQQASPRWALMKSFDITKDGDLYLHRRRIVQTPWFALYLHRIYREDRDRHPHDHPWNFTSVVLRGGYEELTYRPADRTVAGHQVWSRWSWHRMRIADAHKITYVRPGTVTLIFCGRRQREWGFWTEDGFVEWEPYLEMARARGWDHS